MRNIGCITLLLFLLSASFASADNKKLPVDNYKKWSQLPSKELLEKGHYYYDKANLPDSAMLCYSIVASRYNVANKKDTAQLKIITKAMNQVAILYNHYYGDYQKAYSYLLMAQELAEKYHFNGILVSVYINLSNLYLVDDATADNDDVSERTFDQHRKAFFAAIKEKEWNSLIPATFNYAMLGDSENNSRQVVADLKAFHRLHIPDSILGKAFLLEFCKALEADSRKDYDQALKLYDRAFGLVKDRNPMSADIYRNSILHTKCRLLIKMKRDHESFLLLQECLKNAEKEEDHSKLYVYHLALRSYYNHVGNPKKAEEHELTAYRERNIVMSKNRLLEAGQTEFLFQINKMNEEMKELSYERRIQQIVIISIAVLTLLLIYIAVMLYRRWRKTQATNRQLYQRTQDLLAADEEHHQQLLDYEARLQELTTQPPAALSEVEPAAPTPRQVEYAAVSLQPSPQKYRTHQVSEEESSELLHRILYIMENSDEIYENAFSLGRLTELVDARTPNYVSQAINQHYHRTFSDMLNDYRIREACRRLNNHETYGHLTNEALAETVGFLSYPNFVKNFKKFTGLTPSAYQKQVKEKN